MIPKERHFDDEHGYFDFLKPKTFQDLMFLEIILLSLGGLVVAVSLTW